MKKSTLIVMASCVFSTIPAYSQPGMGGYERGMMGRTDRGMMGGYGHGMMDGLYAFDCSPDLADLTTEQQSKISAIRKEFRQKQWALMEKMHDDARPGNLYRDGKFDEQAARKAFDARTNLHKQMFEHSLEMHKRIEAVLTPKQRQQLQR